MKFNNLNEFEKDCFKRLFDFFEKEVETDKLNIFENMQYNEKARITIYQTPFNSIVFAATEIYNDLKNILKTEYEDNKISLETIKSILDYNEFQDADKTLGLFLNPAHYCEVEPPNNFKIRKLEEKDKEAFIQFKAGCPENDLQEGQISFEDPIVVGCFAYNKLIAAASYWFWGEGLADIGIVVHPDCRKQGIGRALISKLAGYGLQLDRINVYRHNEHNSASHNLALSLNFKEKLSIESSQVLDI